MKQEPLISVILVNYNGYDDTRECVRSLLASDYRNIRICIVDNASSKNIVEYDDVIKEDRCDIVYLKNNIGFAGGNNVGIEYSKKYNPDYYLILNNDTVVKRDFLKPLLRKCIANDKIGIATGKVLYYDEPSILWFGGSYFDSKLCEYRIKGIGCIDNGDYDQETEIYYTTGCFMLIPAAVLNKVGKMSEDYFLYYEDADYCERIKSYGFSIYYLPKSIIYHKESRSTNKGSDLYNYYINRNYMFFVWRYARGRKFKLVIARMVNMIKDTIRRRLSLRVMIKVWVDFILNRQGKMRNE